MANTAHSTVVRLPHPLDASIGATARNWESDICDLYDIADVTSTLLEDLESVDGSYTLNQSQVSRILFCAYDTQRRIALFKDAYYAAIDAK